jgi:hypothetical protein
VLTDSVEQERSFFELFVTLEIGQGKFTQAAGLVVIERLFGT